MDPVLQFEQLKPGDETDRSLRAYVASLPSEKLATFDPQWSDDQITEWDGNFRNDGTLMMVCCERDIEPADLRQVVVEFLEYRNHKN